MGEQQAGSAVGEGSFRTSFRCFMWVLNRLGDDSDEYDRPNRQSDAGIVLYWFIFVLGFAQPLKKLNYYRSQPNLNNLKNKLEDG